MPSLAQTRQDLIDLIKEGLGVIASMDPVASVGQYFESVCAGFQGLAICNLLLNLDSAGFAKNLVLSGYTRRYYLRRSESESTGESLHDAISRTSGFFDAIVGGSPDVATEIATASIDHWIPDGEYEDDYCYQAFWQQLLQHGQQHAGLAALLERFLAVLEDSPNPRYLVCKAMLDKDAAAFTEAFAALLAEHQQLLKTRKGLEDDDPTFVPRSSIFVEGLAILWFAEQAGFPTEEEYELCPQSARSATAPSPPADIYVIVEQVGRS
jgi:hypothetical protein